MAVNESDLVVKPGLTNRPAVARLLTRSDPQVLRDARLRPGDAPCLGDGDGVPVRHRTIVPVNFGVATAGADPA